MCLFKISYFMFPLLLLLVIGCSNHNGKANKLFVEASQLVESLKYKQALEKLELIIKRYPQSDLAVKLVQGEAKIGRFTYSEFKNLVVPAIEEKWLERSLRMYAVDSGKYPTTEQGLAALINKPTLSPQPKKWNGPYASIEDLKDPWGNPYQYKCPGTHIGNYDLYSYGPDCIEGTNDDIGLSINLSNKYGN